MTGWLLFAALLGLLVGLALGLVAAYFIWRWYEGLPEKVVMGRKLRSKVLESTVYDDAE